MACVIKPMSSNLTVPGLLKFNNTRMKCYTSGIVTSVVFIERRIDTILRTCHILYNSFYIIGKLDIVTIYIILCQTNIIS